MPINKQSVVYSGYVKDHLVEIEDNGAFRSLYFGDRSLQSRMSLLQPQELVLAYTGYMIFPLLINPNPRNILIVGIGSGSFIRFFHYHYSECQIDAVDHSLDIVKLAKGYFQLPESDRISFFCADGRAFLEEDSSRQYDLILIDAFDDQGMAPTVYSDQFFSLCAQSLQPDGVISCNIWSDNKQKLQEIKTILGIRYTSCLYLPVPGRGNIVAIAMPYKVPWPRILLKPKKAAKLTNRYAVNFRELIKIAKRNNLGLSERLSAWLL